MGGGWELADPRLHSGTKPQSPSGAWTREPGQKALTRDSWCEWIAGTKIAKSCSAKAATMWWIRWKKMLSGAGVASMACEWRESG